MKKYSLITHSSFNRVFVKKSISNIQKIGTYSKSTELRISYGLPKH